MPSHETGHVLVASEPCGAFRPRQGERQFRTYDTSYIRPKRSKAPLVFAAVLAVVVVGGLAWGALTLFNSCSGTPAELLAEGEEATIVVSEGSGAQAVGSDLQRARLVGTVAEFTKRVTELGMESSLKPARTRLPAAPPSTTSSPVWRQAGGQRRVLDHSRRVHAGEHGGTCGRGDGRPHHGGGLRGGSQRRERLCCRLPVSGRGRALTRSKASCSPRPTR